MATQLVPSIGGILLNVTSQEGGSVQSVAKNISHKPIRFNTKTGNEGDEQATSLGW